MFKSSCQFIVLLIICYSSVFCELTNITNKNDNLKLSHHPTPRDKKPFYLFHHLGWQALAIAYFMKVKLIIIAFVIGSAFFWGIRYLWSTNCHKQIDQGSHIIYEHPELYEHVPYFMDNYQSNVYA